MAILNRKQKSKFAPNTTNRAGGTAFAASDRTALASVLLTSFFSGGDTFYEGHDDRLARLEGLVAGVDPVFAAKAAVYARDRFGMRTASHYVATMLAGRVFDDPTVKARFFEKVVVRPDDMLEIVAGVLARGTDAGTGKPTGKLPNALKRGFAKRLSQFDAYSLGKYKGEGKEVNMFDLVNMVHPKATDALTALMKGTLATPKTFETALTAAGQIDTSEAATEAEKAVMVAEAKGAAWKGLLIGDGPKIGYMALLKNLRNIVQSGDAETVKAACDMLVDEGLIRKSRVLPFRFVTAYFELAAVGNNRVLTAVSRALDTALANAPSMPGKTLVALDTSASMTQMPIPRGKNAVTVYPRQIGEMFLAAFMKRNPDADAMLFSATAVYVPVNTSDSVVTIAKNLPEHEGGTNFNAIFETANKAYDRVIILSDLQGWMASMSTYGVMGGAPIESAKRYRAKFSCDPWIYSWDLLGYGDLMFHEEKVVGVAGWMGDKVFDLMATIESGLGSVVEEIEKVVL